MLMVDEYQKLASRTIVDLGENSFKEHLINSSVGISCEAAEVLQHIQRNSFCKKPLDTGKIIDECGDILWYISYLLTTLNVSLEDCMKYNLYKVSDRYKDRWDNSCSNK